MHLSGNNAIIILSKLIIVAGRCVIISDTIEKSTIKSDSAKDVKEVFGLLVRDVANALGKENVTPDYKKLSVTVKTPVRELRIALKKGCSGLGRKNADGEWVYPDDDIILYTPELDPEKPVRDQFHIFQGDEFLRMWQELGLVRYKVSTSGLKQLRDSGITGLISSEKYADYISVQSFFNSRKKTAALMKYLESKPLANEGSFVKRYFGDNK